MLNKITALWNLFKAGEAVSDPAKWKSRQVTGTMLAALVICLVQFAKAFNIDIPIDEEAATAIGAGLVAVINIVLTITTGKSVGVAKSGQSEEAKQDAPDAHIEQNSIDDDTRKRAEQWVKQQPVNQLENDA